MKFIPEEFYSKETLTPDDKVKLFEEELLLIQNKDLREFTAYVISKLPDFSFTNPASGSGKYHAKQELGRYGQTVHIKRVIHIGKCMLGLEQFTYENNKDFYHFSFDFVEQDCIFSALILHDGLKFGNGEIPTEKATVTHPIDMADFVMSCYFEYKEVHPMCVLNIDYLLRCIRSHMGEWNKDREGNVVLPKPRSNREQFVHLCDYLGSRGFLTFEEDKM